MNFQETMKFNRSLLSLNDSLKFFNYPYPSSLPTCMLTQEGIRQDPSALTKFSSSLQSKFLFSENGTTGLRYFPPFSEVNFPSKFIQNVNVESRSQIKNDKNSEEDSSITIKHESDDQEEASSTLTDTPTSIKQEDPTAPKLEQELQKSRKTRKHYHQKPRNYWLHTEDLNLLKLVEQYGKKWTQIASLMEGRNGKQVRDRYMNYLRPNIKQREWTDEEDNLLIKLYREFGNRWSRIALYLHGRTENQVKNRFHAAMRKEKRRMEKEKLLHKSEPHLIKLLKNNSESEILCQKSGQTPNFQQTSPVQSVSTTNNSLEFYSSFPHLNLPPAQPVIQSNTSEVYPTFDIINSMNCQIKSSNLNSMSSNLFFDHGNSTFYINRDTKSMINLNRINHVKNQMFTPTLGDQIFGVKYETL